MSRPQSLTLILMVAVFWAIVERRLLWLIPLGVASAWLFDGFILPLTIPGAALVAGLVVERRLDWRPLAYLALGTVLGILVHPYFPRNLAFALLHLFPKTGLSEYGEIKVGSEWYPYSPRGFATRVGPALAVMVAGLTPVLIRLWRRERPDTPSIMLTLLALGFLALQVRSQRIIEYFPAFAVLLAAWSWSTIGPSILVSVPRFARRAWLPLLLIPLLAGWLAWSISLARRDVTNVAPNAQLNTYRDAALWLASNTPERSLVFNTDWDDFPQLFFWNSHNVYVVGLDITFMSIYDPELYGLWRSIANGSRSTPSIPLRDRFGAQYVISDTRSQHRSFLSKAAEDPGLEEVFRSSTVVVFRVR